MMRTSLLSSGVFIVLLSAPFSLADLARAESPRPNIILCMGDDHGWDETGYYRHPHLKTPVLDTMAASGLQLDHFYSAHPSCSPTRGSVITGRHPNRYGTFAPNFSMRPEEVGIAHILSRAGYACGHFGKWHLGAVKAGSPVNPGAMGFQQWLSHDNFFEMNPVLSRNGGPPQRFEGEGSEVIVEDAIRFIGEAKRSDKPFLAVVWFGSPHEPYSGTPEDLAIYQDLPARYADKKVQLTSMKTGLPTRRPLGEVLQERYAEITAMDRAIGKLRDYLKKEGLRRNTLLWYCGDNGVPRSGRLATPFRAEKGLVYEGGIRVPGIIEWPARIPQGRRTQVPAVTSDILPTLCSLLELQPPNRPLDGENLAPLIDGELDSRPTPICFWHFNAALALQRNPKPYIASELQQGTTPLVKRMAGRLTRNFRNFHHHAVVASDFSGSRAIRDNRYKLVIGGESGEETDRELFDLHNDPAEKNNLIAAKPDVAAALEKQLRSWQASVLNSLTGADYHP